MTFSESAPKITPRTGLKPKATGKIFFLVGQCYNDDDDNDDDNDDDDDDDNEEKEEEEDGKVQCSYNLAYD